MNFHATWHGPAAELDSGEWDVLSHDGRALDADAQALLDVGIAQAKAMVVATPHDGWHNVNIHGLTATDADGFSDGDLLQVTVALIADQQVERSKAAARVYAERVAADADEAGALAEALAGAHLALEAEHDADVQAQAAEHIEEVRAARDRVREALDEARPLLDAVRDAHEQLASVLPGVEENA